MNLPKSGREYYKLAITTTPATLSTDWSASFDGGTTWVNAVDVSGSSGWLVAGPTATIGSAVAVITGNVTPTVRLTANPEIIIRSAPTITLGT